MTDELRRRLAEKLRGSLTEDEPMARHTSLRVGGPADLFAVPADLEDLVGLAAILKEAGEPFQVIGGGYNLLIRDGGIRGVVISLERLNALEQTAPERIRAAAGVRNHELVRFAEGMGLAGLEFLCGIPGTVGGALAMNAGAHGGEILPRVESLTTLRNGRVCRRNQAQLDYGYRTLKIEAGEIIVEAEFALKSDDPAAICERVRGLLMQRGGSQKVGLPNAGSFFKNPTGNQAWRLIDDAGLRGSRVGAAQVSEVHTNFLVNAGGATARDFEELAGRIKAAVLEKSGIVLEEEVRIIGEARGRDHED